MQSLRLLNPTAYDHLGELPLLIYIPGSSPAGLAFACAGPCQVHACLQVHMLFQCVCHVPDVHVYAMDQAAMERAILWLRSCRASQQQALM